MKTEVVDRLEREGYIARQSKSSRSWSLTLGGPKLATDIKNFKGLVLINRGIIFGTCQTSQIIKFCNQVMERIEDKWIKRKDVLGDDKRGRVTVKLSREQRPKTAGKTNIIYTVGEEQNPIHGYISQINFNNERYEWRDIEDFLIKISSETTETYADFTERSLSADEGDLTCLNENENEAYTLQYGFTLKLQGALNFFR